MKNLHVLRHIALGFLILTVLGSLTSTVAAADSLQFLLPDGDNITCVKIEEQTSFADMDPASVHYQAQPETEVHHAQPNAYDHVRVKRATQLLDIESLKTNATMFTCPPGTIPVREDRGFWFTDQEESRAIRTQRRRAERATIFDRKRIYSAGRTSPGLTALGADAVPAPAPAPADYNFTDFNFTRNGSLTPHEYGAVDLRKPDVNEKFKGVEGAFNIWAPYVAGLGEFSLGQFWLTSGSYMEANLNTIEAGFQVTVGGYGDMNPRLFIYWTADAYGSTGCYNLECPGFVQVSNKVLIGGTFAPLSHVNHTQYEVVLRVFKDDVTGNWWLRLNDENVGYWPRSLFTELADFGENMSWGGEIIDDQPHADNHHTETDMGSGEFAEAGLMRAAFIRTLQYVDVNNTIHDAPGGLLSPYISDPACYTVKLGSRLRDWGSYFFYGGGGYSANCTSDSNIPLQ